MRVIVALHTFVGQCYLLHLHFCVEISFMVKSAFCHNRAYNGVLQYITVLVQCKNKLKDSINHRLTLSSLCPPQVPAKTDCVMCFGPLVPDGYGVCYNPMEEHINFAVSAFNSCEDTNASRLAQALEAALVDMRDLLEQTPKAKL